MRDLVQNTTRNIDVFLADSADHVTGKTGLTLTIKSSKAGAAFATITPTVTELESGWYKLALTTGHTDTLGDLAFHVTGTGADPSDWTDQVVAYNHADAVRLGLTALPNAAAGANLGLPLGDASGRVDIGKALGTAVTLDANNVLNVSTKYWAGTAITATSIPVATAAGAAGGLFIAGTNAATTVNITGSLSGSVGSIASGGISSSSFAAGAIDASAIATAVGSQITSDHGSGSYAMASDYFRRGGLDVLGVCDRVNDVYDFAGNANALTQSLATNAAKIGTNDGDSPNAVTAQESIAENLPVTVGGGDGGDETITQSTDETVTMS